MIVAQLVMKFLALYVKETGCDDADVDSFGSGGAPRTSKRRKWNKPMQIGNRFLNVMK
jgi:hypothetical protein